MRVHFIAIGGAVMHNLALALHNKGFIVTGSDDEIFEPARSRLLKNNLLPEKVGWDKNKISKNLDAIILGMHARQDNPELIRAKELGIKIYSFPEFIYKQTKNKKRLVIGGSHGKTTITSIIMHVLKFNNYKFDYLVGSQIESFDTMVDFMDDSEIAVFEGDEYLTSPIDPRPKFHVYKPNVALISGIAWDHINVFPTFENYVKQFEIFIDCIQPGGCLIYNKNDQELNKIIKTKRKDITYIPYSRSNHEIKNGITYLINNNKKFPVQLFGNHNLENIEAARLMLKQVGVTDNEFYDAIQTFKGAVKRLQLINKNEQTNIYLDFAHSPSKLKATIEAVKNQFLERKLVACMELHTFSSLSQNFLEQYSGAMDLADTPIVYFDPKAIEHKKLPSITINNIEEAFKNPKLIVKDKISEIENILMKENWKNKNLLLMSSGNFSGMDVNKICEKIL